MGDIHAKLKLVFNVKSGKFARSIYNVTSMNDYNYFFRHKNIKR